MIAEVIRRVSVRDCVDGIDSRGVKGRVDYSWSSSAANKPLQKHIQTHMRN